MIDLIIKGKDKEETFVMKEKMQNALAGSPGYIDSEIAICDETETSFHLVIGDRNDCDITRYINIEDIKKDLI